MWNLLISGEGLKDSVEPFPLKREMRVEKTKLTVTLQEFLQFWYVYIIGNC